MNKQEFAKIVLARVTSYPKEKLFENKQTVQQWFERFSDLPAADVSSALADWVKTEKWSPSIAELRKRAEKYADGHGGLLADMMEQRRRADFQRKGE